MIANASSAAPVRVTVNSTESPSATSVAVVLSVTTGRSSSVTVTVAALPSLATCANLPPAARLMVAVTDPSASAAASSSSATHTVFAGPSVAPSMRTVCRAAPARKSPSVVTSITTSTKWSSLPKKPSVLECTNWNHAHCWLSLTLATTGSMRTVGMSTSRIGMRIGCASAGTR